jgi:hypothetical protein
MRVKNWTRNINIFEKDFVVIPINKSAHWYLAIICYPALLKPEFGEEKSLSNCTNEASGDKSVSTKDDQNVTDITKVKADVVEPNVLDIENDESLDEAESINEDLNGKTLNSENKICTKM